MTNGNCLMRATAFILALVFASARAALAQPPALSAEDAPDAPATMLLPPLAPPQPIGHIDESTDFPPLANSSPHVWTELPPVWRAGHTLIYDSRRDRLLVIGGSADALWQFRTRPGPDAQWRRFSGKGEGPVDCRAAVYDEAHDRLLVYGLIEQNRAGVWELPLGPSGHWGLLNDDPALPVFFEAVTALDAQRARLFVAGRSGSDGSVWQFDLGEQPSAGRIASLPGGIAVSAVFDASSNVLYIVGQSGTVRPLNVSGVPVWETPIQTTQPWDWSSSSTRAVLDPQAREMLLVGIRRSQRRIEALALDSREWRTVSESPSPDSPGDRIGFAAAYDATARSIVVHGGTIQWTATFSQPEVFDLHGGGAWRTLKPWSGGHRLDPPAVYDPIRDRILMLVGFGPLDDEVPGTVLVRDLGNDDAGLIALPPAQPLQYFGSRLYFDRRRDRIFMLGASAGELRLVESAAGAPPDWHAWNLSGDGPASADALYDEGGDRLVVLGYDQATGSRTIYELGLATLRWHRFEYDGPVPPQEYGWAFFDPGRNCIWYTGRGSELYRVDLDGTHAHASVIPIENGRDRFVAYPVFFDAAGSRIICFPHLFYPLSSFSDIVTLGVGRHPRWERERAEGAIPGARYGEPVVYDEKRDRLIIDGGYDDEYLRFSTSYALSLRGTGSVRHPRRSDEQEPGNELRDARLALERAPGAAAAFTGALDIRYALAGSAPARLDLIDIGGRRVISRDLSTAATLRSGTLRLAEPGRLPPGVYFVVLRQAGEQRSLRVAVLR